MPDADPTRRALGYLRCSTDEQVDSGLGLLAQQAAILADCDRRGWEVTFTTDEGFTAANLKRPAMQAALDQLAAGDFDVLVCAKLDRLSRSVLDFAGLMETAQKQGWQIVCLDCAVDTTTPAGEAMAGVMAIFAQLERRLISERTKQALAAKKAQGVRLGAPAEIPQDVEQRIWQARQAGDSYQSIADRLNAERVPTARGGVKWHTSTVHRVAARAGYCTDSAGRW